MTLEPVFALMFVLTGGIVLWGMLTDAAWVPKWIGRHDKLMHFLAFAGLAALAQAAWPDVPWVFLWMLLTGLGLLAEGLQHLTANRSFCWRDALANALGAAAMLGTLHWLA
ncbi:MAG: hypothetical protein ACKOFG_13630 [Limnohabitans sp.]